MSLVIDRTAITRAVPMLLDPVLLLSERLPAGWIVERSTDPSGQAGIVVFAEDDGEGSPTFFIYEEAGQIRLARILNDEWMGSAIHQSYAAALATIMAAIVH
jgi:hypothetical protein